MTTSALFKTQFVLRIVDASVNHLKYWVKIGLVSPQRDGKKHLYTFRDIITLKVVSNLKNNGLSFQKIRKGIDNLTEVLPSDDDPLSRLILFTDGHDMVAMEKGMYFSATSMQRYFLFDLEQLQTNNIKIQSEETLQKTISHPLVGAISS